MWVIHIVLIAASVMLIYGTNEMYKKAAQHEADQQKALNVAKQHLRKCEELMREMEEKGEKLKNVYLNARSKENR